MHCFDFLGITFEGCGIFDSDNIPGRNNVSRTLTSERYVVELPLETGGKNYVDGDEREINPHTLIFVKPASVRYTVYPLKCLSLHFKTVNPDLVKILDKIPTFLPLQNRNKIYSCFLEMIQIFTNHTPHFEVLFVSKFLKLIDLITQASAAANQPAVNTTLANTAVKEARKYIDDHYSEKITLEDLSNLVNLSPIYFQRVFAAVTGKTPHKYLLDRRLQMAKELLLVSNYNLTDISNMCGFSSQSRFNVVFKQIEGVTPTEYKKKNRISNY